VWATVSPWLGEAVGLGLDVATRLEIADHVIPGLVALAAAALLATRGAKPGSVIWLGAGAIAFLTGSGSPRPCAADSRRSRRRGSLGPRLVAPQRVRRP
jgi:hypothetical protein